MMLLAALIFRAVAIEFRSKQPMAWWRATWDASFSAASFLVSLLTGIALGNIIRGVPLDAEFEYSGTFATLLNPYALLVGVTTAALFMMHGAIYLVMKTEGELQQRVRTWVHGTMIGFIICYAATTMATLVYVPHMAEPFKQHPALFIVPILNLLAIANIPREIHHGREFNAFLSSCASIAALLALCGIGMFPNLVRSIPSPEHSLTVYNAASSLKTLKIMLIMALIGMPLVIAYTATVYWIFRGKVKLDESSY
jgi:cytochrome d ubiquinol oxidase subunit II